MSDRIPPPAVWLVTFVTVAAALAAPALGGPAAALPPSGPHAGLPCNACHTRGTAAPEVHEVSCLSGGCHAVLAETYHASYHDKSRLSAATGVPSCPVCHGGHELRSGAVAAAAACAARADEVCLRCHDRVRYAPGGPVAGAPAQAAPEGAHEGARASLGCAAAPLTCYTCHGYHATLPSTDPASPISRAKVADTCGSCHPKVKARYLESGHAAAVARGQRDAPTCISCHGGHGILPAEAHAAATSSGRIVYTCARCHEDPQVVRAADLPYNAVEGYEKSYHGIANAHGVHDVATCASCHGAHAILSASNPASPVNPANLATTCGRCHKQLTPEMMATARHTAGGFSLRRMLASLKVYFPVANTSHNPLLISGMGALVGFLSGLFGVGGGFLMTPLLIFIGIPAAVAVSTDACQIAAGASSGAISHSRLGNVDFKMGFMIVIGGWIGGVTGVQLVKVLRNLGNFDFYLKVVYVLILGFIGTSMFIEGMRVLRGRRQTSEPTPSKLTLLFGKLPLQMHFPKSGLSTSALLPVAAGFAVGNLAAFLGVGGGFIMLPAMIYIIGIPTRVAVGTDLFQIVLTSANVTLQQAITNHTVDLLLAVTLFAGSVIGAQFGVIASKYLKSEQIRVFLAVIVLVVMVLLLYQLLATPAHLIAFAKSGGGH
jgi:uncharacterized membrane protein YfcA